MSSCGAGKVLLRACSSDTLVTRLGDQCRPDKQSPLSFPLCGCYPTFGRSGRLLSNVVSANARISWHGGSNAFTAFPANHTIPSSSYGPTFLRLALHPAALCKIMGGTVDFRLGQRLRRALIGVNFALFAPLIVKLTQLWRKVPTSYVPAQTTHEPNT